MRLRCMMLVAVLMLAVSGARCAVPLINGGFEDPVLDRPVMVVNSGDLSLPGWDLWSGVAKLYGSTSQFPALEGEQSLILFSGFTELEQVFPTEPGQVYTVSFLLATTPQCSTTGLSYEVWGLDTLGVGAVSTSNDPSNPQLFQSSFTADSTLTGLLFTLDKEPSVHGQEAAVLDGVSVKIVPVPEPVLWPFASLLAMLGGMILLKRR